MFDYQQSYLLRGHMKHMIAEYRKDEGIRQFGVAREKIGSNNSIRVLAIIRRRDRRKCSLLERVKKN